MGSDVETGRIPGAKSVRHGQQGGREGREGRAGSWLHIITVSEWSDSLPVCWSACLPGTHAFLSEYPICSQIDRLSNVGPRFGKAALACLMTRWQPPWDDYTTREASRIKQQSTARSPVMMASRDVSECRPTLGVECAGTQPGPHQARPGQARRGRVRSGWQLVTHTQQTPRPASEPAQQGNAHRMRAGQRKTLTGLCFATADMQVVWHVLPGLGRICPTSRRLTVLHSSRRARVGSGRQANRPPASHVFLAQRNPAWSNKCETVGHSATSECTASREGDILGRHLKEFGHLSTFGAAVGFPQMCAISDITSL